MHSDSGVHEQWLCLFWFFWWESPRVWQSKVSGKRLFYLWQKKERIFWYPWSERRKNQQRKYQLQKVEISRNKKILFNRKEARLMARANSSPTLEVFQNISCYCLTTSFTTPVSSFVIFQNISCYCLTRSWSAVYRMAEISKHLMLLFNR